MKDQDDSAAIERLRKERAEFESSPHNGLHHGRKWANAGASYSQLRQLRYFWGKHQVSPINAHQPLAQEIARAVSPDEHPREAGAIGGAIFGEAAAAGISITNAFVADWILGALSVLNAAERLPEQFALEKKQ
jgi:hypothetical protein